MSKAFDHQLHEFHGSWMTLARLYQLRNQNESLAPGVSVSQFYALAELKARGGSMSMGEFAQELNLSFAGVNRMIDGLVRKGYVTKFISKDDRRVQIVQLTPTGTSYHALIHRKFMDHVRSTLSVIPAEDRDAVIRGIRTMIESVPKWRQSLGGDSSR